MSKNKIPLGMYARHPQGEDAKRNDEAEFINLAVTGPVLWILSQTNEQS